MDDVLGRLNLYLLSGGVALKNQSLPQADSLFKAAIKLIQEVPSKIDIDNQPTSSEEPLISYLNSFFSMLVVMPGHPEQGPFYLIKGLLKVISDYPWEVTSTAKCRIFLNMLSLMSTYFQTKIPYRMNGVDSNDILYGGDSGYTNELQAIINKLLELVLDEIAKYSKPETENTKLQGKLAIDVFNYIISYSELNAKSATLAFQLYGLASKAENPKLLQSSLLYLKTKEGTLAKELHKKLVGS